MNKISKTKIVTLCRPVFIRDILEKIISEIKWRTKGKVLPPPTFIKERTIRTYAKRYSTEVFIETGTFFGGMVLSVSDLFDRIYSIELDQILFKKARNMFILRPHINIFQGDSSTVLPMILSKIDEPALFWLDGHYSGGVTAKGNLNTPVLKELELILNHKNINHVILIDDARLFVGTDDYPTLAELESYIKKMNPKLTFKVSNDIIRITKV